MAENLFFGCQSPKVTSSELQKTIKYIKSETKQSKTANGYEKPEINYTNLVLLALKNNFTDSVVISDVYRFVLDHFPFYQNIKKTDDCWKRSLRHTIWEKSRRNIMFRNIHEKSDGQNRINYSYSLNPKYSQKLMETAQKLCIKNQDQIKRCMKRPELFESIIY